MALQGIREIQTEINMDFDHMLVACGTGTTLAGLIAAASERTRLWGIAALKGAEFLIDDVKQLLPRGAGKYGNWNVLLNYHHGGFAKTTPALLAHMDSFQRQHSLALDPIYTAKATFAAYDMLDQGCFEPGQRIVLLHTGGLQGART